MLSGRVQTTEIEVLAENTLDTRPIVNSEISQGADDDQWDRNPKRHNEWMVERYGHLVPDGVLNVIGRDTDNILVHSDEGVERSLVKAEKGRHHHQETEYHVVLSDGTTTKVVPSVFEPHSFGTQVELEADRRYHARTNYARIISSAARKEHKEVVEDHYKWLQERVWNHSDRLIEAMARLTYDVEYLKRGSFGIGGSGKLNSSDVTKATTNALVVIVARGWGGPTEPRVAWEHMANLMITGDDHYAQTNWSARGGGYARIRSECYDSWGQMVCARDKETRATVFGRISANNPAEIARLAGCEVSELPFGWQHCGPAPYIGNSILNRIDPVDAIRSPWQETSFTVGICLSKKAFYAERKRLGLPAIRLRHKEVYRNGSLVEVES